VTKTYCCFVFSLLLFVVFHVRQLSLRAESMFQFRRARARRTYGQGLGAARSPAMTQPWVTTRRTDPGKVRRQLTIMDGLRQSTASPIKMRNRAPAHAQVSLFGSGQRR
jgi:hypothetical protein